MTDSLWIQKLDYTSRLVRAILAQGQVEVNVSVSANVNLRFKLFPQPLALFPCDSSLYSQLTRSLRVSVWHFSFF